jgi:PAS domain S-box-containing protein
MAPSPPSIVEGSTSSPRLVGRCWFVARLAALSVVLTGGAVLIGWAGGLDWLKNPGGLVTMMPNTALLVMLGGLSLGCATGRSRRRRAASMVLAGACGAASLLALGEDIFGRDLGVDTLLFHARPARPSAPTALALLVSSVALLSLDVRPRRGPAPAEVLATAAATIAWLAFGGYLFGAIQFYAWGGNPQSATGMALPASTAILALALGTVAVRPESGAMAIFTSRHMGGQVARRMLLIALLIPVIGFFATHAQRAGWYEPPGAAVVESVAGMLAAVLITLAVSSSLERTDVRRRQLEEESRAWKRFFDRATIGAGFGTGDGRIGFVNEAFARMHGATVAEFKGQPIDSVFAPDRRAELAEHQRIANERGQSRWESVHLRKDGSTFPVIVDLSALSDEHGAPLHRAAFVQDVTREKAAEETRNRLASVVRSADDSIVAEGPDGTILEWNQGAERIFGYTAEEMVGGTFAVVVPEERRAEREALRAQAVAGESAVAYQSVRTRKDGARIDVAVTFSPIRDTDRVVGVSVIDRDISEIKLLERQREEWASVVAHDLRQPASTIYYATEALARAEGGAARDRAVDSIRKATARLKRMISDLLDVTRIEAHRLTVRPEPVRLPSLVTESIATLPGESAARVRTDIAPDATFACADADRVVQVMSNLLSNADKYGNRETPIDVCIERSGDTVRVSVTNEGAGIAPDEIPKLFSRFGRTSSAQKGATPGLGLGLYMSRGIVEAHGGKLWAESTPGHKTHFRFTLPKAPEPTQERAPERSPTRTRAPDYGLAGEAQQRKPVE